MPDKKENKPEIQNTLVVGLGASAGGLESLQEFFKSLPKETDMAFIVVLHLSPDKESNLTEILQRETSLKVEQVQDNTEIEREHIYVIPPNKILSVEDNHLELSEPEKEHGIASIDVLFCTLGQKKRKYSAGIIFSGTGSDGVTGMKIIKEEGGITLAQSPDEATHGAMPSNVIQAGVVDKVLSVQDMVKELIEYRETLYKIRIAEEADKLSKEEKTEKILSKIFNRLRSNNNHDFSNYRRSSVLRRIDRRMRVNRTETLEEYLQLLDEFPEEIDKLYKDLLITVTNFFRDPEAFEILEKKVIPKLFENKQKNDEIRIWVPGCASGEEAYSFAILINEYASNVDNPPNIQIFASDVDNKALSTARVGRYPKSISNDITDERLKRFFHENGEEYLVKENLRDMILFASHDLLRDPPFSRLDLITCRNLLIYLNKGLQTEVFKLFHYALRKNGWLFLGKSDSRLGMENLFSTVNKEFRIYRQKTNAHSRVSLPDMPLLYQKSSVSNYNKSFTSHKKNLEKKHWGILARLYAPQSVLISEDYDVIHSTDGIDKYLQYSGGEPSQNILNMVKPGIYQELRSLLFQLKSEDPLPVQKQVQVKIDEESKKLELIARRFNDKDFPDGLIHVVFKEISEEKEKVESKRKRAEKEKSDEKADILESLEKELDYTREQLQLSVEEYETANEELRASNEELQSMNEELQSTTEELETSQEELQSVNEELKTVNEQLESKLDELSRTHSDLENLMETTEVGIIFVNRNFCVQRFTSTVTNIFNLIPSDEGRPLEHITHSLEYENLMDDIRQVLESLDKIKKAVKTKDDRWYIMRLRPYRSSEDKIEGVVLSFTEFTELKEARESLEKTQYQESLAILGVYVLEQDDLEMIMHRAIQQSCAILDLKCAAVILLDDEKKSFSVASESGCDCKDLEVENDEKWDLGYALRSKKPVNVFNYKEEKRFSISPLMADANFISSAHITIRGSEKVFGILALYSKDEREFTQQDLHFLQVVANILGRSMEQKMFQKELLETNEQLQKEMERNRQVKKEIINNNVLERWQLGGYLHDNFGQFLASVKILADDIKYKISTNKEADITQEVEEINQIMDECIAGIRDIVHDIVPVDVEQEGVAQAFRVVMNHTFKMYDVRCILENDDVLNEIKNRKVATHLYYIVQEAIKNAATHGKADLIVISAHKEDNQFVLTIKDDGVGLSATKNGNGKGIRIMSYRMDLLDGFLKIEDYSEGEQSGTVVRCTLPVENLKRDENSE